MTQIVRFGKRYRRLQHECKTPRRGLDNGTRTCTHECAFVVAFFAMSKQLITSRLGRVGIQFFINYNVLPWDPPIE